MPNRVINEAIFIGNTEFRRKVKEIAVGADGKIDFTLLLPIPLYCWQGGVSSLHMKRFPDNALNWCSKNWSTKWGAYGKQTVEEIGDTLTLSFDTAWSAPFGWYAAIFNSVERGFQINWLSEGEMRGHTGIFSMGNKPFDSMGYDETPAISDDLQKHLHLLRWGVEEFPDEDLEVEGDK